MALISEFQFGIMGEAIGIAKEPQSDWMQPQTRRRCRDTSLVRLILRAAPLPRRGGLGLGRKPGLESTKCFTTIVPLKPKEESVMSMSDDGIEGFTEDREGGRTWYAATVCWRG